VAKRSKKYQSSDSNKDEAIRIAHGTQRPGQVKEQTKLIAQGIQKGIEQYKKQQNAKARELDKKLKKANQQVTPPDAREIKVQERVVYRQHWLPWVLLVLTWLAVAVYWFAN
jgi:hypothetical protein